MTDTLPRDHDHALAAVVQPSVEDSRTGARWVHKDLAQVRPDWEIGPAIAEEAFGDVESWASYIGRFSEVGNIVIRWNSTGLQATLDYHSNSGTPGRMRWNATLPFLHSTEWDAWTGIAHGRGVAQRTAIEFLEDHANDITSPPSADLLALLRSMRATVNKAATTELRPDGTTYVTWTDDKGVAARGATADLPSEFTIAVPILKGHVDAQGTPVVYELKVRLRASVDDQARLSLRLSMPNAERALESVYADQVATAKRLLSEQFDVLRAAG